MTIFASQIFIALFIALGNGFLVFLLGPIIFLQYSRGVASRGSKVVRTFILFFGFKYLKNIFLILILKVELLLPSKNATTQIKLDGDGNTHY